MWTASAHVEGDVSHSSIKPHSYTQLFKVMLRCIGWLHHMRQHNNSKHSYSAGKAAAPDGRVRPATTNPQARHNTAWHAECRASRAIQWTGSTPHTCDSSCCVSTSSQLQLAWAERALLASARADVSAACAAASSAAMTAACCSAAACTRFSSALAGVQKRAA